jgi:hypothetical protein
MQGPRVIGIRVEQLTADTLRGEPVPQGSMLQRLLIREPLRGLPVKATMLVLSAAAARAGCISTWRVRHNPFPGSPARKHTAESGHKRVP